MDLFLFESNVERLRRAIGAGIAHFVCDWETRGKDDRQSSASLEINRDTPDDVRSTRHLAPGQVVCRINALWERSGDELDAAIDAGADIILLPMATGAADYQAIFRLIGTRPVKLAALIETRAACEQAEQIAQLPLAFVYVGFNDLQLDRRKPYFSPLVDGTLAGLRAAFAKHRFGFGGVTVVDGGEPLSCRLLMSEMARLGCDVGFLRRSFKRDCAGRDMQVEVARIEQTYAQLLQRSEEERLIDRRALEAAVGELP